MSGVNATHDSYTANLSETLLHTKNKNYKATVYWVDANSKTYLFEFY